MAKNLTWNDENIIEKIAKTLIGGGVLLSTTDTVLGLLACANEQGIKRLNDIKCRENKPYLVILNNFDQIRDTLKTNFMIQIETIGKKFWPGPITLILSLQREIYNDLSLFQKTIAVRVPAHDGLRKIAAACGPLLSTSANLTGQSIPRTIDEVDSSIKKSVDLIVISEQSSIMPSTILDCTCYPFKVVREGAISLEQLKEVMPDIVLST